MSEREIQFVKDEYYHVYNRGVDKRKIFLDEEDYKRFIKGLCVFNSTKNIEVRNLTKPGKSWFEWDRGKTITNIGAYCLMPNHFHILIKEKGDGGLSKFMRKTLTSYSMYFNKKHARTGTLFENTFKSIHVESDRYLKYLFAYIHLNPVKLLDKNWKKKGFRNTKRVRQYLEDYSHSSYLDYCGEKRLESKILDKNEFPKYFEKREDFIREIGSWLTHTEEIPPYG